MRQTLDSVSKALDGIPNPPNFVKFRLQFVNLPEDRVHSGNLGIGPSYDIPGEIILQLCR